MRCFYPEEFVQLIIAHGFRIVARWDWYAGEEPYQFSAPHGMTVDSRGDLYIGEVSWSFKGKNLAPPQELPTFRKLVKV
jgi:hypothetical protein